ncbi:2OG-Fe(II) oxygenase [Pseudomonas sp. NPDC089569]|uniref:2OG-Fe(II) oxygenase n=1 Tax=Pseudomonas sp. NPDC089569 TaxID=3390722 RepID=UPI003CFC463E
MLLEKQLNGVDWRCAIEELNHQGWTVLPSLFSEAQCHELASLAENEVTVMAGTDDPNTSLCNGWLTHLTRPAEILQRIEEALYSQLYQLANKWNEQFQGSYCFPRKAWELTQECNEWGQHRSLTYLSRYGEGDHELLHQCVKGGQRIFPLQAVVLLSQPGKDFQGGELFVSERIPGLMPKTSVLPMWQGDVAIFAFNKRPILFCQSVLRAIVRYGVQRVQSGERVALNLVFHKGVGQNDITPSPNYYEGASSRFLVRLVEGGKLIK